MDHGRAGSQAGPCVVGERESDGGGEGRGGADAATSPPEYAGDYWEGLVYLAGTWYPTNHLDSWHTRRLASPAALPAVTKPQAPAPAPPPICPADAAPPLAP